MCLEVKLSELLQYHRNLSHSLEQFLNDGLSGVEFTSVEERHGVSLPNELRSLYAWRNGTARAPGQPLGQRNIIPGFVFYDIDRASESFVTHKIATGKRWELFPFFGNAAGDYFGIVYNPESKNYGNVIATLLGVPEHYAEFESLERFIDTILQSFRRGVFFTNSDGMLDAKDEQFLEIAAELNPSLPFYNEWRKP